MKDIVVIIPTRNRPELLLSLLGSISKQTLLPQKVIVVDSSEVPLDLTLLVDFNFGIELIKTSLASAAGQRNLGIDSLSDKNIFLMFLDDDTVPEPDYIENLSSTMRKTNAIGISGVTVGLNKKLQSRANSGISFAFRRLFFLESKTDGSITKGGIGIPVRMGVGEPVEVKWLIGCSIWNFETISDIRFEKDFIGQSLGEDVIFSYLCSKRGKLFVDPGIHLTHVESSIGRPDSFAHQEMWIVNRFRLFQKMDGRFWKYIYFNWTNLGRLFSLIAKFFVSPSKAFETIKGFTAGYFHLMYGKK